MVLSGIRLASFLGFCLCLASLLSIAQTPDMVRGVIDGRVTVNGEPFDSNVFISIRRMESGIIDQSNARMGGHFSFGGLTPGTYVISTEALGYENTSTRVELDPSGMTQVEIEMKPLPRDGSAVAAKGAAPTISVNELAASDKSRKELMKGEKFLIEKKEPQESIRYFQKAIEKTPEFARAHLLLGIAQMELQDWREAERALTQATTLDPSLASAYLALGTTLNQEHEYARAVEPLLKGLSLMPDSGIGHFELARAYWVMNDWQKAEPHARAALQFHPVIAAAHVLMGDILLRKHDQENAIRHFETYLQSEPNGPLSDQARAVLTKVRRVQADGLQH